mgnify:CR=1 FL=1
MKENNSGIYKIKCTVTGQIYIGSSGDLKRREKDHFKSLINQKHRNIKLQRSFNKYGLDNFVFSVIEFVVDTNKLINKEQFYVDTFNPYFNMCKIIVNSSLGIKRSKEVCEKLSKAQTGMIHSDERRKKKSVSQGGENHWTKKKNFSEESRIKMSETHKKRIINGGTTYFTENKLTKEQREMGAKSLRAKICKPIVQLDLNNKFIKEWSSARECLIYGYNPSGISSCCMKKNKTHKNFKWLYKKEYNGICN